MVVRRWLAGEAKRLCLPGRSSGLVAGRGTAGVVRLVGMACLEAGLRLVEVGVTYLGAWRMAGHQGTEAHQEASYQGVASQTAAYQAFQTAEAGRGAYPEGAYLAYHASASSQAGGEVAYPGAT